MGKRADSVVLHPKAAPGDFYSDVGCCTGCDVPRATAPTLFKLEQFGSDPTNYVCYVCRQPQTGGELRQMIKVLEGQEFDCIRYRGSDPQVLAMIPPATREAVCDDPAAPRATFRADALFLESVHYHRSDDGPCLDVIVTKGWPWSDPVGIEPTLAMKIREAHEVRPGSARQLLRFTHLVAYQVVEESLSAAPELEIVLRRESFYTVLSRSAYLDHVDANHLKMLDSGPQMLHYRVFTADDVIDVVGAAPPSVRAL